MESAESSTILLERLARILQNETHAGGLKPTQWEALRYLARANRFSRNPSALTAYLGTTKGTVSQTLNALERKGLLTKKTDPADRRQVDIDLTKKARHLLDEDPIHLLTDATASLPAGEQAGLTDGLRTVLEEALRRRGGRPFGVCRSCRFFRADDSQGAPHRCGLLDVPLSDSDSRQICVEQEAPC